MRGSLVQRSPGSWTLILDLGYEPDPATGILRRKQKWQTFRGTKKQAEGKLSDLLSAVRNGQYVDPSKMTLGEWLTEWIEHVAPSLRQATVTRYRGTIANHVQMAAIAGMPLQKLRASHLESYYATISTGSRSVHHTVLRRALRKAVKERLIVVNPVHDLDRAPRRSKGQSDDARVNCWSAQEARTFLDTAKAAGPQPAAFYALALDSGVRKGELCGLRWGDVNLETGRVQIVQQLAVPGPEPVFGPPKNGRSRDIVIAGETVELLKVHRRTQAELKMANRTTYRDHGLVFAKEYGDLTNRADMIGLPLQANHIGQRQFARLVKAANVRAITFHGMRHTCATLLLEAGEPVHVVSRRLGHARVEITLNTYAHVLPAMQEQAAATMGAILHR